MAQKYKALEGILLEDGTNYDAGQEFEVEATEELSQLVAAGKLVTVEGSEAPAGEPETPATPSNEGGEESAQ